MVYKLLSLLNQDCSSFSFVKRISNLHQITELYSEPLNKDQIHLIRTNNKFVFDLVTEGKTYRLTLMSNLRELSLERNISPLSSLIGIDFARKNLKSTL